MIPAIGAGVLWGFLSFTWALALGLLLPQGAINWLVDLITRPGGEVAASWDALAAVPPLVIALFVSHRLGAIGDQRQRVAEVCAWGILLVGIGMSVVTLERQPVPTGVIVSLFAGIWYIQARYRNALWYAIAAHIANLCAVFSFGIYCTKCKTMYMVEAAKCQYSDPPSKYDSGQ